MNNKLLLCSDLDRTLIPNGSQAESPQARDLFKQLVSHADITLAYVTGRDQALVEEAINFYQLPTPDYVIADVGASIYQLHRHNDSNIVWQEWAAWTSCFAQDWQGYTNKDIAALFNNLTELRRQEVNKQKPYKLSYYVPLHCDYHKLIEIMKSRLSRNGIHAELIWSVDEMLDIGLLDVMPKHATKRTAIEFLMQENHFNYQNTIFSGDSGNDLDVLLSPVQSILVANAHADVKSIVMDKISKQKKSSSIYIAQGGFRSMNGNYSAGILEGIQFYAPDIIQKMGEQE